MATASNSSITLKTLSDGASGIVSGAEGDLTAAMDSLEDGSTMSVADMTKLQITLSVYTLAAQTQSKIVSETCTTLKSVVQNM